MTPDLRPLLVVHIAGRPRPKGSMRHVGNGRMVEQLAGSPDWRTQVVNTAYLNYQDGPKAPTAPGLRPPYAGAVKVTIVLELPRPAKPKDPRYPSGANSGDVDKHARNILDALQDAGVVKNDAQVVDLAVSKRWTTFAPGAHITVWPAGAVELPSSPGPGGEPVRTAPPGQATPDRPVDLVDGPAMPNLW